MKLLVPPLNRCEAYVLEIGLTFQKWGLTLKNGPYANHSGPSDHHPLPSSRSFINHFLS